MQEAVNIQTISSIANRDPSSNMGEVSFFPRSVEINTEIAYPCMWWPDLEAAVDECDHPDVIQNASGTSLAFLLRP